MYHIEPGDSMDKYMDLLYQEYLKTTDIPTNIGYKNWLEDKKTILPIYEKFLESMDMFPNRGIIEIGNGSNDSILLYTPSETKGILVSPYVKTEKTKKDKIINCRGELIVDGKDVNLYYKNNQKDKIISVNSINNYVSTLNNENLDIVKELFTTNKNVFLGIYGNIIEKNREERLKELYNIKSELEVFTGKDFVGELTSTNKYYLACITKKLKYKGKKVR